MKNTSALTIFNTLQKNLDWDEIYQSTLPDLFNYFLYRTRDEKIAQDLSSITLERAWSNKLRYRSDLASVQSWIFGIARNVFKEYLREHRRNASKLVPLEPEDSQTDLFDRNKFDTKILLKRLIAMLPEKEQELIALKYGAGLNNREIAKLLHLSESNVGTRLFRIVESLRKKMEVDNE
ncbi:MAG TPA: RNA polymerase sigma factor [Anaerolineaceae bacterium]|nr:RNA polymerase sigma factor [Anaerolineaceae bacterium]